MVLHASGERKSSLCWMCGETNMADNQSGDKMMSVLYLQLVLEPAQKNHLWQFKTDECVLIRNTVEIRDVWLQPDDPDRFCRETPTCFGGRSSPQSASAPGGSARTSPPQTNTRRTAADISSDIFCSRIRPSHRGLSVRASGEVVLRVDALICQVGHKPRVDRDAEELLLQKLFHLVEL